MLKHIAAMVLGAAAGAALGYSRILCFTGECPLTGSWQGGALVGVFGGLIVLDRYTAWRAKRAAPRDA
mgnify:FL=1